jgi:hypothetical protein
MTLDEKLAISIKARELWETGDKEGYSRLMRSIPISPYLAKVAKEKTVAIDSGRNFYIYRLFLFLLR